MRAGIAGSTAMSDALYQGNKNIKELSRQGLDALRVSISELAHQLDSLVEAVLQNQRGLDFLLTELKQGHV